MGSRPKTFWLPGILILLSVGLCLTLWLRPGADHDFGPLALGRGENRTVVFRAGYSELYGIGIEMDRQTAQRLYPCMVDPRFLAENPVQCARAQDAWPVELALSMSATRRNATPIIEPSAASAGGRYSGDKFIWEAAFTDLERGREYELTVRSTRDASSLASARPRLIVFVATPGFPAWLGLQTIATVVVALGLLAAAAVWFAAWTVQQRAPSGR